MVQETSKRLTVLKNTDDLLLSVSTRQILHFCFYFTFFYEIDHGHWQPSAGFSNFQLCALHMFHYFSFFSCLSIVAVKIYYHVNQALTVLNELSNTLQL